MDDWTGYEVFLFSLGRLLSFADSRQSVHWTTHFTLPDCLTARTNDMRALLQHLSCVPLSHGPIARKPGRTPYSILTILTLRHQVGAVSLPPYIYSSSSALFFSFSFSHLIQLTIHPHSFQFFFTFLNQKKHTLLLIP